MDQQALIARVTAAFRPDPRISALFLSGSFGRGTADRFSDVDLLLIADAAEHEALAAGWRTTLESIIPLVFFERLPHVLVLYAIGERWQRCDLEIADTGRLAGKAQDILKPLIDPHDLHRRLQPHLPAPRPDPAKFLHQINEFIRIVGLLPVADGRGEYEVAVAGAGLLRRMLTDLLITEAGLSDAGGALHLSRVLDAERMALLARLPVARPERDAAIEAHLAAARLFFPRAREMARRLQLVWPRPSRPPRAATSPPNCPRRTVPTGSVVGSAPVTTPYRARSAVAPPDPRR
jgi:predicted nucleotidyltransferase